MSNIRLLYLLCIYIIEVFAIEVNLMNKVLITGMAIGKELGGCDACNYDFDWIIEKPSILLWAEKVVVTPEIWNIVMNEYFPRNYPFIAKAIKLIFEVAKDEGIIELVDPKLYLSDDVKETIFKEVDRDRLLLSKHFSGNVRLGDEDKVPGQLFIDEHEYCAPHIYSIYSSLALARAVDAHGLYSESVLKYCNYKFGLDSNPQDEETEIQGFQSVFEALIPNSSIIPKVAFVEGCTTCKKDVQCKDSFLIDLENNLKKFMLWRDYDEIHQIKGTISKIIDRRDLSGGIIDAKEILHDFKDEQMKIRRRVKRVFPKVQRWANLTTMLSIPVAVAGIASGQPLVTVTGATIAGASTVTKELISLLNSKYSWIGFNSNIVDK